MIPVLKPIPSYKKYFFDDGRVFGFTDFGLVEFFVYDEKDEKVTLKDFYKVDGMIYMSRDVQENQGTEEEPKTVTVIHYYSQNDKGIIEEIDTPPNKPLPGYEKYTSKNFTIVQSQYQDFPVSTIKNLYKGNIATFKQISGCFESTSGMFFNVIESRIPGKTSGLYFFPLNKTSVNKVKEKGFVW